jgi:hypothetical protein
MLVSVCASWAKDGPTGCLPLRQVGQQTGDLVASEGWLRLHVFVDWLLVGEAFSVQVLQRSSILDVKRQVQQQTGGLGDGWLRVPFDLCISVCFLRA